MKINKLTLYGGSLGMCIGDHFNPNNSPMITGAIILIWIALSIENKD